MLRDVLDPQLAQHVPDVRALEPLRLVFFEVAFAAQNVEDSPKVLLFDFRDFDFHELFLGRFFAQELELGVLLVEGVQTGLALFCSLVFCFHLSFLLNC